MFGAFNPFIRFTHTMMMMMMTGLAVFLRRNWQSVLARLKDTFGKFACRK